MAKRGLIAGLNSVDNPSYMADLMNDINLGYSEISREAKAYDLKAINSMIENILTTVPGERPFEPEFGSTLPYLLHEPCDNITAWKMESAVFDALKRWMPYIDMIMGLSKMTPVPEQGAFDVRIVYKLKFANVQSRFEARFMQ
jgi:phage baseplate assembly protein W